MLLVPQQRDGLVPQQRDAVLGDAAQLSMCDVVSHDCSLVVGGLGLLLTSRLTPALVLRLRRLIEPHAEAQAHACAGSP